MTFTPVLRQDLDRPITWSEMDGNLQNIASELEDIIEQVDEALALRSALAAPDSDVPVGGVPAGEITQRLDDAEQRIIDLPDEVDAAGTAATLVGQHNNDATAHPALSAFISQEADRAETAAEVAAATGRIYQTSAAGQADVGLVDGDYFWVVSTSDVNVLELWRKGVSSPTDAGKRTVNKIYVDAVTEQVYKNVIPFGDFIDGSPVIRSGSSVVDLTQDELTLRGYKKGIQQRLGNEYVVYDAGQNISGKYLFGCFIEYSTNPSNLVGAASYFGRSSTGTLFGGSLRQSGSIALSSRANLVWFVALLTNADSTGFVLGTTLTPVDSSRLMTGFFGFFSDTEPSGRNVLNHVLISDKARYQRQFIESKLAMTDAKLTVTESTINQFTSSDTFNIRDSVNLFDEGKIVVNSYLTNAGAISNFAGWARSDFIPVTAGQPYTISGQRGRHGVAFFANNTTTIPISYDGTTSLPLTVTAPPGANYMVINVYQASNQTYSNLQVQAGSEATTYEPFGKLVILNKERIYPPVDSPDSSGDQKFSKLILGGESGVSYIESRSNGDVIRRGFAPFVNYSLRTTAVFNFRDDSVNGITVRDGGDDTAPIHAFGTTIAANHGYFMGEYTATAHGKTTADFGGIYEKDGVQYVLMGTNGANTVFLAHRTENTVTNTTGTFNHVSGGSSSNIMVSAFVASRQWYPPFQNRSIKCFIDGIEEDRKEGEIYYRDKVVFVESYDVLGRQDLIDWFIANGSTGEVYPVNAGQPAFTMSNSYEFDIDGNCTIYMDWLFLAEIPFRDIMGVQCGRTTLTHYYVPKTLPFTQDSVAFNYAMIEPSNKTIVNNISSMFLTPERCEPDGLLVDRVIGLTAQNYFAMGFVPTQDAALARRRELCTRYAMEIRGNTGKLYPRVVDTVDRTTTIGEYYSVIAYRNIAAKQESRTSAYPVRTRGDDYFYCDWHNISKLDRVEIPKDFAGRDFEIVEARNATLYTSSLTGSIAVNVNCVGDYAYLIIKIK